LRQLQGELGITDVGGDGSGGSPVMCFGDKYEETPRSSTCQVRVDDDGEREMKKQRIM